MAAIEIELPDGIGVRVGEEIGLVTLRRALAALRGCLWDHRRTYGSGWSRAPPTCGAASIRLTRQMQEALGQDPFSGQLFVFRGRRGDLVKAQARPHLTPGDGRIAPARMGFIRREAAVAWIVPSWSSISLLCSPPPAEARTPPADRILAPLHRQASLLQGQT